VKRYQANFREAFWGDLMDAFDWYEERQPGLGARLQDEVLAATKQILRQPEMCKVLRGTIRRAIVSRFRYLIVFELDGETVHFLGLVHGMRHIPRWLDRRTDE
jgi:plasmid stabilization system protein ParE